MKAQYLSGPETKYNYHTDYNRWSKYWMVTKCHRDFSDKSVIQLCTNPGLDGSVDSVLPVTLATTDELFRNKYCVLCNNIDLNVNILYWNLDIYADTFIKFPEKNILNRIRSNRENIFFIPPMFIQTSQPCKMPEYTISKCNETGLWGQYDEHTELVCNSFIDPYNHTYKNVFCFICNRGFTDPEFYRNATCNEKPMYDAQKPGFRAMVSRKSVLGYLSEEELSCGTRQYYDTTLVSCKLVFSKCSFPSLFLLK